MMPERCARCGKFLPRFASKVAVEVTFEDVREAETFIHFDTGRRLAYGLRPVLPLRINEVGRERICPNECRK